MEKIAIISDIHGNIVALDAALEDIKKRGITRIFCLGDMVVKCASPKECVDKTFENCEIIIKGNCEERVTNDPRIEEHYWNMYKLSKEQRTKIFKLPLSYDFYMSGYKIRLMHASPFSIKQKSYYWNFDENFYDRFDKMFENTEYLQNIGVPTPDIVIFGHIHKPIVLRHINRVIINPGSISNSSDLVRKNGEDYMYGSYLILEGNYGDHEMSAISYEIVKFVYNHKETARLLEESDMPNKKESIEEILTGKYFSRRKMLEETNDKK